MEVKISTFRACVGGYVGGGHVHPALLDAARESLAEAKESGAVADGFVARCGDDIDLVLLHEGDGVSSLAHGVFASAASAGARLRQHGNGGIKPDGATLAFVPRPSEPVLCFFSNKTAPGAWNLLMYRMLADPFTTPGLVTDPGMREGFSFQAGPDTFDLPADLYKLLAELRSGARISAARSRSSGEVAAVVSAGSDPALLIRCEPPFPSVEDVLEAFSADPSPLVPVSANTDPSARSMPRAIGLGFQVTPERLIGPRDLLGDAAFDDLRRAAVADARRSRNGSLLRESAPV